MSTATPAPSPAVAPRRLVSVDVHQHLWPEPLIEELARRTAVPRIRRVSDDLVLQSAGERDSVVSAQDQDPGARAARARGDGVDAVVVTPATHVGIEALPAEEAAPLIDAWHRGVRALPRPFLGWAAAGLDAPDPQALADRHDEGFVGLCLPAAALAGIGGLDRVGPLLEVLGRRAAPLLVHPGPAPWSVAEDGLGRLPGWWPSVTRHVAEIQAAWHLWMALGRTEHPDVRVCFALLAGLAPLHHERLRGRGGPASPRDPRVFYDVSSYGPRAVRQMADVVGRDSLVNGSDRSVVGGTGGGRVHVEAFRRGNAARLLGWEDAA